MIYYDTLTYKPSLCFVICDCLIENIDLKVFLSWLLILYMFYVTGCFLLGLPHMAKEIGEAFQEMLL
jgi:hypothetical protein